MARSHDTRPGLQLNPVNPTDQVQLIVLEAVNDYLEPVNQIEIGDVYIYQFTYVVGGWKAHLSTTIPDDRIYEVTHEATGKTFCDVYVKERQVVIEADHPVHQM